MYSQYQYTMNNACNNLLLLATCESTAQRSFSLRLNSMVLSILFVSLLYIQWDQYVAIHIINYYFIIRQTLYIDSYFTCGQRCQKSYHRDNWLVAAERSKRCRFLILRCRLFLYCTRIRVQGFICSLIFLRERELGLDRRETGQFYPTVAILHFFFLNKLYV